MSQIKILNVYIGWNIYQEIKFGSVTVIYCKHKNWLKIFVFV